jgi:hypothetical protein
MKLLLKFILGLCGYVLNVTGSGSIPTSDLMLVALSLGIFIRK